MKFMKILAVLLAGLIGNPWMHGAFAQTEIINGEYLCGYGKVRSLTTYINNDEPVVLVSTEWLPSWGDILVEDFPTKPRAIAMRGHGFRANASADNKENFLRRQEILSQVNAIGASVRITAAPEGDLHCGGISEKFTIKLCRNPLDCCQGYAGCGNEDKFGARKAKPVTRKHSVTEDYYE